MGGVIRRAPRRRIANQTTRREDRRQPRYTELVGSCPTCVSMPLVAYEASPGVEVELCTQCRGLYLDRQEIRQLVGRGSLARATEVIPVPLGEEAGMRCPKCVNPAMQPLRVQGAQDASSWQCRSCGGLSSLSSFLSL